FGATNSTTGKVVWKIQVPQPAKSGMLVAGDLVFFGEGNGQFHAVDATTGKMLHVQRDQHPWRRRCTGLADCVCGQRQGVHRQCIRRQRT
ncbi:MAG: PQQ-binding-like beta-propeller repeat protein, partial [Sinobacteraceae bacterium]|nr:PQQ-binding-like beta-propeller repeat protein [Nevskiaceae bacterium]